MSRLKRLIIVLAAVALILAPAALALRFTDASLLPPRGKVGVAYSHQLDGAGGCGPALPYQFRILSGSPPAGLSLSKAGLIDGTPTASGDASFWVELSDQDPPSASWCAPAKSERELKITIDPADPQPPPPPPATKLYWDLRIGSTLLHTEEATTYPDKSTGLTRMIAWRKAWEPSHLDAIRGAGSETLVRLRR